MPDPKINVVQDVVRYLTDTGPFLLPEDLPRQTNSGDTTAGRLLEVGSLGLGGKALEIASADLAPLGSFSTIVCLDTEAAARKVPVLTSPAATTQRRWFIISTGGGTPLVGIQIGVEAFGTGTTPGRMFTRTFYDTGGGTFFYDEWLEVGKKAPGFIPAYASAARPSAATLGAGAVIYDTGLQKPLYSNGTQWRSGEGEVAP